MEVIKRSFKVVILNSLSINETDVCFCSNYLLFISGQSGGLNYYNRCFVFSEMCLVQPDPALYSFINQGVLTVNGIDDVEEMGLTDVSFVTFIHI